MEGADEQPSTIKVCNQSVLDCPICFHPLTIPVFQCDFNGHIACSSCHRKLIRQAKCPTCSMRLGNLRNRAIESVVESLETSCSYKINGCPAKIRYSNKRSHEDTCVYGARFTCPFPGCNYKTWRLYNHLENHHKGSVFPLRSLEYCPAGGWVEFSLGRADKLVAFLQDDYCSLPCSIFVLGMQDGRLRVNTIDKGRQDYSDACKYTLTVGHKSGCWMFDSVTSPLRDADVVALKTAGSNCLSQDFLRLLDSFIGQDGPINLKLEIFPR